MRAPLFLTLLGALSLTTPLRAEDLGATLGEGYAKASPAEKIALISEGVADKRIKDRRVASQAVDELAKSHMSQGKTAEARLKILGDLRKESTDLVSARSKEMTKAKKQGFGVVDVSNSIQEAAASAFLVEKIGGDPTIEALACLSFVRDCTAWTAHGTLIVSVLGEALDRDKTWLAADRNGKLEMLRELADKKKMCSNFTRTIFEKGVIANWLHKDMKAGKAPSALIDELKAMEKAGLICFFTRSWAEGLLKTTTELPSGKE
jgi:hypothetical protein